MPLGTRVVASKRKWVGRHFETGARKIEACVLVGIVLAALAARVDACGKCVDVALVCGEYVLAQAGFDANFHLCHRIFARILLIALEQQQALCESDPNKNNCENKITKMSQFHKMH